jgi:putative cell wall-binding protein
MKMEIKGIRKCRVGMVAVIVGLCLVNPLAAATSDSTRLAGSDRITTALEIALAGWQSADTVIIAAADPSNLVDSLAVAPLAGQEKAPILLTFKVKLDPAVRDRIIGLEAKKVYVVGAVSSAVVNELRGIGGLTVERLAGQSRWETNELVTAKLRNIEGTFVVGYNAIPDALSVAPYAAAHAYQILLADANGQVSPSKLRGNVYLIGGRTMVQDIAGATRLSGNDRYATNVAVIRALDFRTERVYVANGVTLVDALAASSLAALSEAPVMLSNGATVPAMDTSDMRSRFSSAQAIALGGTATVAQAALSSFQTQPAGDLDLINNDDGYNLPQVSSSLSYELDLLADEYSVMRYIAAYENQFIIRYINSDNDRQQILEAFALLKDYVEVGADFSPVSFNLSDGREFYMAVSADGERAVIRAGN